MFLMCKNYKTLTLNGKRACLLCKELKKNISYLTNTQRKFKLYPANLRIS